MSTDNFIQPPPDTGTGKKVRTLTLSALQSDGSIAQVQMQVVSIADESGNALNDLATNDMLAQMLTELRGIRRALTATTSGFDVAPEDLSFARR
jgi:hypothetical protein